MPLQVRFEGTVAILGNVGKSMNDPRYVDAGQEVRELLDQGFRHFVIELRGVAELGPPLLGLLMTMTRQIRRQEGEVVLAGVRRGLEKFLDEMRLEGFWDVFPNLQEATRHFDGADPGGPDRSEPGPRDEPGASSD